MEARRQHDARVRVQPRLPRTAGRALLTLPIEWADDIGGDGLYGGDYAEAFNFTALYELESDPYETTDLQASRPDVPARAPGLRGRGAPDGRRRVHVRLRVRDVVRQPVHDVADTGDCFVVPWETPGETHKGKHDDKHDNHRRARRRRDGSAGHSALPGAHTPIGSTQKSR